MNVFVVNYLLFTFQDEVAITVMDKVGQRKDISVFAWRMSDAYEIYESCSENNFPFLLYQLQG
jgi:hypothetical protein